MITDEEENAIEESISNPELMPSSQLLAGTVRRLLAELRAVRDERDNLRGYSDKWPVEWVEAPSGEYHEAFRRGVFVGAVRLADMSWRLANEVMWTGADTLDAAMRAAEEEMGWIRPSEQPKEPEPR